MPQQLLIRGGQPGNPPAVPVECGAGGATVANSGPWPVYYRDEAPVSAFVNDGSVASGASVTLFGAQYLTVDRGDFASSVDTATVFVSESSARGGVTLPIAESDVTNLATDLAGKAQALTATAVKSSAYTAAAGDFVPVDTTSGAVTITLPSAPASGTRIGVKMVTQGGTNAVTVACGGSDVFNKSGGVTSASLALINQALVMQYASGVWIVHSTDVPLAGLDGRFQPIDSDLTAIAALSTTSFGRSLLTGADGAAVQTLLGIDQQRQSLAADLSITNSTTLVDVGLPVTIGASSTEIWRVDYLLLVEAANGTMDMAFNVTAPTACEFFWGPYYGATTTTAGWSMPTAATTPINLKPVGGASFAFGTTGVAGKQGVQFTGIARGGGTAGTLALQVAQSTADAGTLKVDRGSHVLARKFAA